jgi:hypothetical protein
MTADSIVSLKVTLDHVEPLVLRRVEVPLSLRLDRLHTVLQIVMGFENCHLWAFRVRDVVWGPRAEDFGFGPPTLSAAKATLADVVARTGAKTIKYTYDFGDDWEHTIKLGRVFEAETDVAYPPLAEAVGHGPIEDCGGPFGFMEFAAAINDPEHERHEELREWWGERPFDAAAVDFIVLARRLGMQARRWRPKRAA